MLGGSAWGQVAHPADPATGARAAQLFQAGSAAYGAGDLKSAHDDFAQLVRLAPKVAAAHSAYGAVLLAEGNPAGAIAELRQARRLDPTDGRAAINLAMALHAARQEKPAVEMFAEAEALPGIAFAPDESVAYASALAAAGDLPKAQSKLESALGNNPSDPELEDALGSVLAQRGSLAEARDAFQRALTTKPDMASAHAHLGSALLALSDPAAAIEELRRAQQLGDSAAAVEIDLGRALVATGQDAEALTELHKALASDPSSTDAKYALALALQGSGSVRESLPLFKLVATQRPKDAAVLTNYGLALVQSGDAKNALILYNQALALGQATSTLRENMGVAYLQENDVEHAIEQFRLGLVQAPEDVQLHYDLGLAYKLKDDLAAAVPELRHAEELNLQLPDPPYTLGVIEMQQGHFSDAERDLERTISLRPDNGEAWSLLGTVYKNASEPTKAQDALHHAIALQPEQPGPHITLASVLAEGGDKDGAAAERKIAADLSRKAVSRQRSQFALDSGRALLAQGKVDQALTQLQTAVAAEPARAETHLVYAEALSRAGRKAEALAERQKAESLAADASHSGDAAPAAH